MIIVITVIFKTYTYGWLLKLHEVNFLKNEHVRNKTVDLQLKVTQRS